LTRLQEQIEERGSLVGFRFPLIPCPLFHSSFFRPTTLTHQQPRVTPRSPIRNPRLPSSPPRDNHNFA
jgi:hypothetical protein